MDVKLGELGSWLGGRDFTPNGVISAVRRGETTTPKRFYQGRNYLKIVASTLPRCNDVQWNQYFIFKTWFNPEHWGQVPSVRTFKWFKLVTFVRVSRRAYTSRCLQLWLMRFVSLPGHDRYYNKYINVKKGGIGGVAMVLVGYVALSYLFDFEHLSKTCTNFLFIICFLFTLVPLLQYLHLFHFDLMSLSPPRLLF